MYCICCKKDKVFPNLGEGESEEEILWLKKEKKHPSGEKYFNTINNEMVNDGIIHIIEAGYGSKHDGDKIIIAICDDCIKENLDDGGLLFYDNYLFSYDENFIKDGIEKSKKIYRRRKNLDKLTNL